MTLPIANQQIEGEVKVLLTLFTVGYNNCVSRAVILMACVPDRLSKTGLLATCTMLSRMHLGQRSR